LPLVISLKYTWYLITSPQVWPQPGPWASSHLPPSVSILVDPSVILSKYKLDHVTSPVTTFQWVYSHPSQSQSPLLGAAHITVPPALLSALPGPPMLDSPAHNPEEHFPTLTAFLHTDCP
jgi:hypothetical protein